MSRREHLEELYFLRKELYSLKRKICIIQINRKLDEMTEYALLVGDINQDGKLTAADARKILRISAKLE